FFEVKAGDRSSRVLLEEVKLALIKTFRPRTNDCLGLFIKDHAAFEKTKDIIAVGIEQRGEIEFLYVGPQQVITGICEMLGAGVRVEAVGEVLPLRADVSPRPG